MIGGLIGISGGALLAGFLLDTVSRTITNLYVLVGVREIPFSFIEAGVMSSFRCDFHGLAYFPARQAAKLEPREVIYQRPGSIGLGRIKTGKTLSGIWIAWWPLFLTGLPAWNHWPVGGFSATLALTLGFSFYCPILFGEASTVFYLLAFGGKRIFCDRLGVNYVNRYLSRMSVAMAALMIAIAMLISVSLMIRSFRQAVDTWISQSVSGDLFIGPMFPSNQAFSQFLDPQVTEEIEKLNGLSDIYHYRGVITELKGFPVRLWSGDLAVIQRHGGLAFTRGKTELFFKKP